MGEKDSSDGAQVCPPMFTSFLQAPDQRPVDIGMLTGLAACPEQHSS